MIGEVFTIELDYTEELSYDVDVKITWFEDEEADYTTWDSDSDYYGFTDVDYDILKCIEYSSEGLVGECELPSDLEDDLYEAVLETIEELEDGVY